MKLSELVSLANDPSLTEPLTKESLEGPGVIEVLDAVVGVGKKSGAPQIKLTVRVLEGPTRAVGRRTYDYLSFGDNPDALPFLLERLGCLGLLNEELLAQDDMPMMARMAKGKRARVTLYGDEFNGRISPKVRSWVEPWRGAGDEAEVIDEGYPSSFGADEEPF